TDAKARAEYEPHVWHFAKKLLPGINIAPPGYTSARSAMKVISSFGDFMLNLETWEQIEDGDYVICGSPATVRQKLVELGRWMGVGNLLVPCRLAPLPADLTRRNMELFAREVLPHVRRELAQPAAGGPTVAA